MNDDGSQTSFVEVDGLVLTLRIPDPWYANPETGEVGPLALGVPAPLARQILSAPPIPVDSVERVRVEIARRLPDRTVPSPTSMPEPELVQAPPRPMLRLFAGSPPRSAGYVPVSQQWREGEFPIACLEFQYGPVIIGGGTRPGVIAQGGRLFRVQQNKEAEAHAGERLRGLGFAPRQFGFVALGNPRSHDLVLPDAGAWIAFLARDLPALRAEGWAIEQAPDFPIRLLEAEGAITAEFTETSFREGSGIDWFELHLGVTIGGEQVDLVPALVRMIASEAGPQLLLSVAKADTTTPFLVPLLDRRIVSLPLGRVLPIIQALGELFARGAIDPETGRAGFTRNDAADLAALEDAASDVVWRGADSVRSLGRQLREVGGAIPSATLPTAFAGTLRPYQQQGVDRLQFLAGAGLGGVLADDMGLGKTVQTLAHLAIEQAEGRLDRPALIVCPTSLVPNWHLEARRFAPSLKVLSLHGPMRRERFPEIASSDLVITTYPLLTRDQAVLTAQDWHMVVLDEAQTIKNPMAAKAKLAGKLTARQRLCLSGTPLENHLGELWSLFDFLAPGFLGNAATFRHAYRTPIEKHGSAERLAVLVRRVRPFLLRRTKEEVAADLPPKSEIVEPVELEDTQRSIYDTVRLAMHSKVRQAIAQRGLARSGIIILDALLKMRQVCCDPRLLKLASAKRAGAGSAKLDRLMELLAMLLDEQRRVLVFSQFTSMLALIEERLRESGLDYVLLTGDTVDRQTPIARFQSGEAKLFLLSLKAGGTGLNLTAADTVIHYDPWWNPAVEDQATDRAHRIGQDKPVFVHRLVTLGTIEEKMETLKARKRALAASILDAEHGGALTLSEADIEDLFAS